MKSTATLTGPKGAQADAPVEFLLSTTQFGTPARLVSLDTCRPGQAQSRA